MKQTNYHLFDFMDFTDFRAEHGVANDPAQEKREYLWKAYAPTNIEERNGDIVITIPYQKQLHQEDMAPDTQAPQQSYDLIVRAMATPRPHGEDTPNIIRLFTTMCGDDMADSDDMLQM